MEFNGLDAIMENAGLLSGGKKSKKPSKHKKVKGTSKKKCGGELPKKLGRPKKTTKKTSKRTSKKTPKRK